MREARAQALEQLSVKRRLRRSEPVEAPQSIFTHFNEPRPAQVVEVMRRHRLGHFQDRDDVADTEIAILQQMEDSEPRAVGERTEHPVDSLLRLGFNCNHVGEYSDPTRGPQAKRHFQG